MIPLFAALLLAGAAGAGPVLVSDACGQDTTTSENGSTTRCAVEKIDRRMKSQDVPSELKVRRCVFTLLKRRACALGSGMKLAAVVFSMEVTRSLKTNTASLYCSPNAPSPWARFSPTSVASLGREFCQSVPRAIVASTRNSRSPEGVCSCCWC